MYVTEKMSEGGYIFSNHNYYVAILNYCINGVNYMLFLLFIKKNNVTTNELR